MGRIATVFFIIAFLAIGYVTIAMQQGTKNNTELEKLNGRCGVERWNVKTMQDGAPVILTPRRTTIAKLVSMPVPVGFSQNAARLPGEGQVYQLINTKLVSDKLESDSDYHLILQSSSGQTMIAEIPAPYCAQNSSQLTAITNTRNYFDQKFGPATRSFHTINKFVTITGVAFFDVKHGQTGVAPNGIELHPVLSIR